MKRFTETNKWNDTWFRKLPAQYKLLWMFILDNCDNAGLWEFDLEVAGFFTGFEFTEEEVNQVFGDRIIKFDSKVFIPKFIEFQYGELNSQSRPHKSVIEKLEKYNLLSVYDNFLEKKGYAKGIDTLKDKDKDKDKVKDKDKGYPNFDKVIEYGKSCGIEKSIIEEFYYHYDGQGWVTSGENSQPISNWQSKLKQWNINHGRRSARASPNKKEVADFEDFDEINKRYERE